jgi:hypothetical protein
MRQIVNLSRAIRRRKDRDWYSKFVMAASANGHKVKQTFDELFPEYTKAEPEVAISPETATLMERLAAKQKAELEASYAQRK